MYPVLVNCFPKCGLHATWKALYLLGVNAQTGHYGYHDALPPGVQKQIFVKRDPRNALCSAVRFDEIQHSRGLPLTPGTVISKMRDYWGKTFVEQISKCDGWFLPSPDVLVIRYEDLVADDSTMRKIADFVGAKWIEDAFENLPGHTRTWNEVRSDYLAVWNEDVEKVWKEQGGPELLERWGYV